MIESISFHYNMLMDLYSKYSAIHGTLQKLADAGYTSQRRYNNTVFSEAFKCDLECSVSLSESSANLSFRSNHFYKSSSQTFCSITKRWMSGPTMSTYNGFMLNRAFQVERPDLLGLTNHSNTLVQLSDTYDDEVLEACEFQLLTKYNVCETTAILLDQVMYCDIKNCLSVAIYIPPFIGLGEEKEKALMNAYLSTTLGLQHEIDNLN